MSKCAVIIPDRLAGCLALLTAGIVLGCGRQGTNAPVIAATATAAAVRIQAEVPTAAVALRLVQTIALPGVEGRIDHLAVDVKRQRLFVNALGNNSLEVVDLRAARRLQSVSGLHEPQGAAFAASEDRLFVANGGNGECNVFSGDPVSRLSAVNVGGDADNVRYDAAAKRIYVGYGDGALAVLDATNGAHAGQIPLAGHPESFQLEQAGPRLYVNVPSAGHIAVVDRATQTVTATWPLDGARANFPMALDEAAHRLFIGCRNPARVLVYNTTTGKVATTMNIDGDTDDLFWDIATKRLYVSCGAGYLDTFQQQDADHYSALSRIPTAAGARTSLFVPALHRLYLAVPHRGAQPAEIRVYATVAPTGKSTKTA